MCLSVVFWSEDRKENMNNLERLKTNFWGDGEEVKGDQETSEEIGRNGCKVSRGEAINGRNEEKDSVARNKVEDSGEKEKNYKLVRVYPTKGNVETNKRKNKNIKFQRTTLYLSILLFLILARLTRPRLTLSFLSAP